MSATDSPPLLAVRDLRIALDIDGSLVPVVDGISFELRPRQVLALVGESGCGKSVTANAIMRLLPDEIRIVGGEIRFEPGGGAPGVDLAAANLPRRQMEGIRGGQIAMIFQEPMSSFSPVHTIGEQVGEPLRLHRGLSRREARERTVDLLAKVGIAHPAEAVDRYPQEFSGGMRQRAMIAKALSCDPPLIIADEPTTALDVTIQAQIIALMRGLQEEFGTAIVFITHDLGVVAQMADEVAIMYTGRIVEKAKTRDIFHAASHPYTVSLLRAVPRLGDLHLRRDLEPIGGNVPTLFSMPSGCAFHPRCASAMPGRCDAVVPPMARIEERHEVCCHLFPADGEPMA
jgi:peptide/nickel transport system ATP-binding protein